MNAFFMGSDMTQEEYDAAMSLDPVASSWRWEEVLEEVPEDFEITHGPVSRQQIEDVAATHNVAVVPGYGIKKKNAFEKFALPLAAGLAIFSFLN